MSTSSYNINSELYRTLRIQRHFIELSSLELNIPDISISLYDISFRRLTGWCDNIKKEQPIRPSMTPKEFYRFIKELNVYNYLYRIPNNTVNAEVITINPSGMTIFFKTGYQLSCTLIPGIDVKKCMFYYDAITSVEPNVYSYETIWKFTPEDFE